MRPSTCFATFSVLQDSGKALHARTRFVLIDMCEPLWKVEVVTYHIQTGSVYETKRPAVILNYKICCKSHIKCISATLARSIGKKLDSFGTRILYINCINHLFCHICAPVCRYGLIHTLATNSKYTLFKKEPTQYYKHTNNVFLRSHMLKFTDVIE